MKHGIPTLHELYDEVLTILLGKPGQPEDLMDQDLRREYGAHYTSEQNILKVGEWSGVWERLGEGGVQDFGGVGSSRQVRVGERSGRTKLPLLSAVLYSDQWKYCWKSP